MFGVPTAMLPQNGGPTWEVKVRSRGIDTVVLKRANLASELRMSFIPTATVRAVRTKTESALQPRSHPPERPQTALDDLIPALYELVALSRRQ